MTTGQIALDVLISLIPPFLVGILFWVIMRSILRADSRERDTYAKIEAEERAKRANALGEQP
jgi:flagellar biosynthesis/type III secretory pathway M-ring protein FliF/YscJ